MGCSSTAWLFRFATQTAAHHARADALRLAIMDCTSRVQYRGFLERIYGFEAAVELRASRISGLGAAAAGARTRAGRLYRDLGALGLTEVDIAALPQPAVDARDASDALGWLFVVERHVLLAGLIRRYLAGELPDVTTTCAYLDTHRDGGAQLRAFGEALALAIARGDARPDAILAAARRAFEAQSQWYARPWRRTRRASSPPPVKRPRTAA